MTTALNPHQRAAASPAPHRVARTSPEPGDLRQAFSRVPTSIAVAAAHVGGRAVGMAIGSFTTISLDPGIVQFSVQTTSNTWPLLLESPQIGISVLAEQHRDVVRQFSGPADKRFDDVRWHATDGNAVLVEGASAHFIGSILRVIPVGDHFVALLDVTHCAVIDEPVSPLVFHESRVDSLPPFWGPVRLNHDNDQQHVLREHVGNGASRS